MLKGIREERAPRMCTDRAVCDESCFDVDPFPLLAKTTELSPNSLYTRNPQTGADETRCGTALPSSPEKELVRSGRHGSGSHPSGHNHLTPGSQGIESVQDRSAVGVCADWVISLELACTQSAAFPRTLLKQISYFHYWHFSSHVAIVLDIFASVPNCCWKKRWCAGAAGAVN